MNPLDPNEMGMTIVSQAHTIRLLEVELGNLREGAMLAQQELDRRATTIKQLEELAEAAGIARDMIAEAGQNGDVGS